MRIWYSCIRQIGLITLDVDEKVTDKRSELLTKSGIKHKKLVGPQITDEFPHLHEYDDKWSGIYEPTGTALLADKCLTSIQVKIWIQIFFKINGKWAKILIKIKTYYKLVVHLFLELSLVNIIMLIYNKYNLFMRLNNYF